MSKKFGKRFACAALAIATACSLGLAGCGSGENDKNFTMLYGWTREGLGGHANAGYDIGPVYWFCLEGMANYVCTTGEITMRLAREFDHNDDHTTTVTLRDDVKWHSGDDFVSDDIIAYYTLIHTTITNYLLSIDKVDDHTLSFVWNPKIEPSDEVKSLLLAEDICGTVPYKEFKQYVDTARAILDRQPQIDEDTTYIGPYNRPIGADDLPAWQENFTAFRNHKPAVFPGTGPYVIEENNGVEMIFTKFEDYYNKDIIGFDKVKCLNGITDLTQQFYMAQSGEVDYLAGMPTQIMIEQILASNPDLAHYKILEPAAMGLLFNLDKDIWTDEVREAFQYILDRDKVRELGNYYGKTSWYPLLSMTPQEVDRNLSAEAKAALPTYSHDEAKAEELLRSAGWNKVNGKWQRNGYNVELTVGYDGSSPVFRGIAEAIQSQLSVFGITVNLKRASDGSTFRANATKDDSPYDLSVSNTELNWYFPYPGTSFEYVYNTVCDILNMPRYPSGHKYANMIQLEVEDKNGGLFPVAEYYARMLTLKGQELQDVVDCMVLGLAKKNYGVQLFQNTSGAFYDTSKINGLPYPEKYAENRNVTYIPEYGTPDYMAMSHAIMFYSDGDVIWSGTFSAK